MSILGWIVLGLVVGAAAKLIMSGGNPGGIIFAMLLGVVGALIGGFLFAAIFGRGLDTFWDLQTWVGALIGSIIVVGVFQLTVGRRGVWRY